MSSSFIPHDDFGGFFRMKSRVQRLVSRVAIQELETLDSRLSNLRSFSDPCAAQWIPLGQCLPIRCNLLAVVFDFLRHDAPGRAQWTCGAVAGFIRCQFESVFTPGDRK